MRDNATHASLKITGRKRERKRKSSSSSVCVCVCVCVCVFGECERERVSEEGELTSKQTKKFNEKRKFKEESFFPPTLN